MSTLYLFSHLCHCFSLPSVDQHLHGMHSARNSLHHLHSVRNSHHHLHSTLDSHRLLFSCPIMPHQCNTITSPCHLLTRLPSSRHHLCSIIWPYHLRPLFLSRTVCRQRYTGRSICPLLRLTYRKGKPEPVHGLRICAQISLVPNVAT